MREFNLLKAQKKGMASMTHMDTMIGILIAVVLVVSLGSTAFHYLGNTAYGLGNSTLNPAIPLWVPNLLIIVVAVGFVLLILKQIGIKK